MLFEVMLERASGCVDFFAMHRRLMESLHHLDPMSRFWRRCLLYFLQCGSCAWSGTIPKFCTM